VISGTRIDEVSHASHTVPEKLRAIQGHRVDDQELCTLQAQCTSGFPHLSGHPHDIALQHASLKLEQVWAYAEEAEEEMQQKASCGNNASWVIAGVDRRTTVTRGRSPQTCSAHRISPPSPSSSL
jgi:hypothetical protein